MTRRGFTLIELLVVVGIIAILAAIAVPNFLEAQTRAKVSAALANQRVVRGALEMYRVDAGDYPATAESLADDPLAMLADVQLAVLTTPLAYLSGPGPFRDPFGTAKLYSVTQDKMVIGGPIFPAEAPPNPQRSMLYFNYRSSADRFGDPRYDNGGVSIVSIGPDLADSMGGYATLAPAHFAQIFAYAQLGSPVSTLYDPTNGTSSSGDIVGFSAGATKISD